MKRSMLYLSAAFLLVAPSAVGQPMSGMYTVGGTSPDFATPQDAANALHARGVSGPVAINIRPGTFDRDGGLSSVLLLEGVIPGASSTNRITFQPDEAVGGNVSTVVLHIDQTTHTSTAVVSIRTDHVTLRNLTMQDGDSMEAGATVLLSIDQSSNSIAEDIVVEGCRFVGNSNAGGGATYGTNYGIQGSTNVAEVVIRHNTFLRLMNAVSIGGTAGSTAGVIVEDNQILDAHYQGDVEGAGIRVSAHRAVIRRNQLDNAGGRGSLYGIVVQADSGLIERNSLRYGGGAAGQVPTYRAIVADRRLFSNNTLSMLIANNMISGSMSVGG